ncbi:MAG TPA: hypothetical protein VMR41_00285 [Patescibacteria group bacterium]|nr:hypothetical protein [Patescibacteria group bacterium]
MSELLSPLSQEPNKNHNLGMKVIKTVGSLGLAAAAIGVGTMAVENHSSNTNNSISPIGLKTINTLPQTRPVADLNLAALESDLGKGSASKYIDKTVTIENATIEPNNDLAPISQHIQKIPGTDKVFKLDETDSETAQITDANKPQVEPLPGTITFKYTKYFPDLNATRSIAEASDVNITGVFDCLNQPASNTCTFVISGVSKADTRTRSSATSTYAHFQGVNR